VDCNVWDDGQHRMRYAGTENGVITYMCACGKTEEEFDDSI